MLRAMPFALFQDSFWFIAGVLWLLFLFPQHGGARQRTLRACAGLAHATACVLKLLYYHRTNDATLLVVDLLAGILFWLGLLPLGLIDLGKGRGLRWLGLGLALALCLSWPTPFLEAGWLEHLPRNDFIPWGLPRSMLAVGLALVWTAQLWQNTALPLRPRRPFVILLIILMAGVVTTEWLGKNALEVSRQNALVRARSLAFALDAQLPSALTLQPDFLETEAYRTLRSQLRTLRRQNSDIAYLYIVKLHEGRMIYPVSGAERYSDVVNGRSVVTTEPLTPYEQGPKPSPEFVAAYDQGIAPAPEVVWDATYGPLLTVFAPIGFDPQPGAPQIGMDYLISRYVEEGLGLRRTLQGLTVAGLALFLLLLRIEERNAVIAVEAGARAKAEESAKTRNEFIGMVSHELQSPLHALLALTQEIPDRGTAQAIDSQLHDLQRLVEDLLQASALQSPHFRLHPRPLRLVPFIHEASAAAEKAAAAKGLTFKTQLHAPLPTTVHADPLRLRQIVVNLLSNAVKYTSAGSIELSVRRLVGEAFETPILEVRIADSGVGLSPELLANLGDPFRRGDGIARLQAGTGLGLSVTRELCLRMGGTFLAEPRSPRGSVFTVRIPLDTPLTEVSRPPIELPPVRVALVVEDHPTLRGHLALALEQLGWTVHTAASCEEAREKAQAVRPSLLLVDQNLPDGLGTSLVKEWSAPGKGMPWIIGMSASRDSSVVESMEAAGACDFLYKPISLESLAQALQTSTPMPQVIAEESTAEVSRDPFEQEWQSIRTHGERSNWDQAFREAHFVVNSAIALRVPASVLARARQVEKACLDQNLKDLLSL